MANKHKKLRREVDINLYVFSNDMKEEGTVNLLQMFYRGAHENTIGIMRAKNLETGEIESLLVGLDIPKPGSGESTRTYPLAKILPPDEALKYRSPDGVGGYFED
jgi:hypothetical protein